MIILIPCKHVNTGSSEEKSLESEDRRYPEPPGVLNPSSRGQKSGKRHIHARPVGGSVIE